MITLDTLSKTLGTWDTTAVQATPDRCLNARHKDAGCRLCVDACPTAAIALGPPIALEPKACVNCGLCTHLCPTGVFSQPSSPEEQLLHLIPQLPAGAIELACPVKEDAALSRAPVSAVVRTRRCLAALSAPLLLNLAGGEGRTLWLNDAWCHGCPLGSVQPHIASTAALVNRLLALYQRPPGVFTCESSPKPLAREPLPRPLVGDDEARYSRRDFFSSLGQSARKALGYVLAESLAAPTRQGPVPVEQRLPHHLPLQRRQLLAAMARLGRLRMGSVATEGLPFAEVLVNVETCSACGLCARFCPTAALSFVADEGYFVLNFTLADCIDCGICALICPSDSVSFAPETDASQMLERAPRVLLAGALAHCQVCGQPTAAREGEAPLCYVCRAMSETQQVFWFDVGGG